MWDTNPSPLQKNLLDKIPPYCVSPCQGWGSFMGHVSASPTYLNVVFLSLVVESSSSNFQIFFRGKWPICSCRFCVQRRRWFRTFQYFHLGFLSVVYLVYLNSRGFSNGHKSINYSWYLMFIFRACSMYIRSTHNVYHVNQSENLIKLFPNKLCLS